MLKIKNSGGQVVGVLKDDATEPEMNKYLEKAIKDLKEAADKKAFEEKIESLKKELEEKE